MSIGAKVRPKGMAAGIAVAQTTLKAFTFLQGLCIAQGSMLGTSLSLIGQAFTNYRDLAVPALVGTEQLCAAFGIASFAAEGIVAMATKVLSGARALAAGYVLATAAATAFCAIPVTWILTGIGAALVGVVHMLSQAGKYTAELSDKMETLREKGDEQRQNDQVRMERLKQLSEKQKLSNAEPAEVLEVESGTDYVMTVGGVREWDYVDMTASAIALGPKNEKTFPAFFPNISVGWDNTPPPSRPPS